MKVLNSNVNRAALKINALKSYRYGAQNIFELLRLLFSIINSQNLRSEPLKVLNLEINNLQINFK